MKRIIIMAAVCAVLVGIIACDNYTKKQDKEHGESPEQAVDSAMSQELDAALADRDSLFVLINEINGNFQQIKDLEGIISVTPKNGDISDKRVELRATILAIQEELSVRRQKLDDMERRLTEASTPIVDPKLQKENALLLETIAGLKRQIADQESTIERLKKELDAANEQITTLNTQVTTLNTKVTDLNATVDSVTVERNDARRQTQEVTDELNRCYYVIGSDKELKEHKIIEKGFLRKTKILPDDFQTGYFTKADKRTLLRIPLDAKKAEVLTGNPTGSYTIANEGGLKVLIITNPQLFWSKGNYLVIKTK